MPTLYYFTSCALYVLIILFGWLMRWEVRSRIAVALWSTASRIYSKQNAPSLCSSQLAFSTIVSVDSNQTIVLIRLQRGRTPVFILSERSDFYVVDNLSKAVHVLTMLLWTWLLVDKILLPKYMNWFTNFRGLPWNQKVSSGLKYINTDKTFI